MTETSTAGPRQAGAVQRFFSGETHIDFVGRSKLWLWISLGLLAICALALLVRGLNFGIDFTGGTSFVVEGATEEFTTQDIRGALAELGVTDISAQVVDGGAGALVSTPALEEVAGAEQRQIADELAAVTGSERIDVSAIGPRWGAQVSEQALRGLIVFLVLVVAYITFRFEFRMAVAALVTLLHDIAVTVGIYALVGFEVSPASVIALLTILGYSLYDTVVVFDRVTESTAGLGSVSTMTYGEAANEALNHVLVRSLSTSITSLLPVGALLFVGANLFGADTLSDLALALFIGMAVGTYSSVFVATPLLVWLKEKEPRYAELRSRVQARRASAAS